MLSSELPVLLLLLPLLQLLPEPLRSLSRFCVSSNPGRVSCRALIAPSLRPYRCQKNQVTPPNAPSEMSATPMTVLCQRLGSAHLSS